MFDLSDYALTVDYPGWRNVNWLQTRDNGEPGIYFPYVRMADRCSCAPTSASDFMDDTYQEWYTPIGHRHHALGHGMRKSGILRVPARPTPTPQLLRPCRPSSPARKPSFKEGGEFTVKAETSHRGEPSSVCPTSSATKPEGIKYYVGAADVENVYEVRVVVPAATSMTTRRPKYRPAVPGAELPLTVNQAGDPDYVGVTGVEAGATTVDVHGKTITVSVVEAAAARSRPPAHSAWSRM